MTTYRDGAVPLDRPQVDTNSFEIGKPVRAQDWHDLARLAHWVAAHGQVVVPGHWVGIRSASTQALRYRAPTSGRAIARVWVMDIRANGGPARFNVKAGSDATAATDVVREAAGAFGLRHAPLVVVEGAGSNSALTRSLAVTDLVLTITPTAGTIEILTVACWELPRAALSRDSTDLGIALDSLFPRRPMLEDSTARVSLHGVGTLARDVTVTSPSRRIGHFARWGQNVETKSGSATSLLSLPYRVVPRHETDTRTAMPISVQIYAAVEDGSTAAEWRVVGGTAGAGSWQTISLGDTTQAWRGPVTVNVDCEDPDNSLGLPSGGYDTIDIQARTTAGTGSIVVQGWTGYEAT